MFRLFAASFLLSVAAMASLPFLLAQDERLVPQERTQVFEDVELAKSVLKRLNPQHMDPTRETEVRVTDDEISRTIRAVLARTVPSASVAVQARRNGIRVSGSAELRGSARVFGRFLNAQIVVEPSTQGLEFSSVSVGSVPIPPWVVKPTVVFLVNWIVGSGKGAPAYESLRRVETNGSQIVLTFKPPAGLYDDFKTAAREIVHRDNVPVIRIYYDKIVAVSLQLKGQKDISFSKYLSPLLQIAKERSGGNDARDENRALILALALYFGDSRFGMLLGEVAKGATQDNGFDTSAVKLSGRHDWVQHFVTTAAIQVAAGSDISNFIGEAKEIVDTEGPSGFSFTDIAADRAGVRFADIATGSVTGSRKLQDQISAGAPEHVYFPKVADLPEGLSALQFKAAYSDVGSLAYNQVITTIDARIDRLPIYAE